MDETKKLNAKGGGKTTAHKNFERKQYQDGSGIPRVVLIPPNEPDLNTGIPISLDLSELYGHMPQSFQAALYKALHAQGLIEPADFFKPGASDRYQRAMRDVIKHDFLNVLAVAKKEL
jgi:hypothetical protein